MRARKTLAGLGAVAVIAATACGGEASGAIEETTAETSSAVTPWCSGPSAPKVFAPGEISLPGRSEHRIVFSRDQKTAYFSVGADTWPYDTLYSSHLVNGHWTAGEIMPFSGTYFDTDSFLSPDGQTFYFSSDRPVEPGGAVKDDFDIWAVHRTATGWGEPFHLGPEVNTPTFHELYPSVTHDGTIYFNSNRPGGFGEWDIYRAPHTRRGFGPAENLGPEVNTTDWEYNPWISPDGHILVFASLNRPGGYGLGDLYGSVRLGNRFAPAKNLGPGVNTAADEYHPTVADDLRHLYFVRQTYNPGDTSDLYVTDPRCIDLR
jgi:hypothetical protein